MTKRETLIDNHKKYSNENIENKMKSIFLGKLPSILKIDNDLSPVENFQEFETFKKKQSKFHFVPLFIIKNFYNDDLYKLQLHNHLIKKTGKRDHVNFIKEGS